MTCAHCCKAELAHDAEKCDKCIKQTNSCHEAGGTFREHKKLEDIGIPALVVVVLIGVCALGCVCHRRSKAREEELKENLLL